MSKTKPQKNDLDPPTLQFNFFDKDPWAMFAWMVRDRDTQCKKNAGTLLVNLDQTAVEAWVGAYDGTAVVTRPEKLGNEYLISEILRYVVEYPEYDPVEVARAVYGVYCDCARQQIIVAIAQRATLTWTVIEKQLLTPEALTMGANHRGDMRYRIQGRIAKLAKRAA